MREALDEAEIARRLPLWVALADLFLDTDVMIWVPNIVRTIIEHGFELSEAEDILRWDVRPAFYSNLLSVAGEWAGWHEDIVREEILGSRNAPMIIIGANRFMPNEEWAVVVTEVQRLRGS